MFFYINFVQRKALTCSSVKIMFAQRLRFRFVFT